MTDKLSVPDWVPPLTIAGEYGATRVMLTRDGSSARLAFGRNEPTVSSLESYPVYHGAVILSAEALKELKSQIDALGI